MDYNDQVKNRVKRIEGQVRGILKMMEEDKDCKASKKRRVKVKIWKI